MIQIHGNLEEMVKEIDAEFGINYAQQHPELVAAYITAVATKKAAETIADSVRKLSSSVEFLARQLPRING